MYHCRKNENVKKSDLSKEDDTRLSSNSPKVINNTTEYRIQFIAMKKPNATFPKLAEVGDISTEFFQTKQYTDIHLWVIRTLKMLLQMCTK